MHLAAEPTAPPHAGDGGPPRFPVRAYPLPVRLLAAGARLVSAVNLASLLAVVVANTFVYAEESIPLPLVARWLVLLSLLPSAFAWLLQRSCAATLRVEPGLRVLELRGARVEIPAESVAAVRPWRLPLPEVGYTLRLGSGRRFQYGLGVPDPRPLLDALGPVAQDAAAHPWTRYADAKHALGGRRWLRLVIKFGVLPLLPAIVFFRLDQMIVYGGPFGGYYAKGLAAYLKGFAGMWSIALALAVLYAAAWRGLFEAVAIPTTWLAPQKARALRKAVEIAANVVYYGGIPALIALRFLL